MEREYCLEIPISITTAGSKQKEEITQVTVRAPRLGDLLAAAKNSKDHGVSQFGKLIESQVLVARCIGITKEEAEQLSTLDFDAISNLIGEMSPKAHSETESS